MSCDRYNGFLDGLLDDTLTERELQRIEAHAAGCAECAAKLRSARILKAALSDMPSELDVPMAAQAGWRRAVRAEAGRARRRRLPVLAGGIAAALLLFIGIGVMLRPVASPVAMNKAASDAPSDQFESVPEALPTVLPTAMPAMEPEADSYDAYTFDGASDYMDYGYDGTEAGIGEYEAYAYSGSENGSYGAALYNSGDGVGLAMVEPDAAAAPYSGDVYESADEDIAEAVPMLEASMLVDNLDETCTYFRDLIAEYDGMLDEQRFESGGIPCANLFIELSSENAADFMEAVSHFDKSGEAPSYNLPVFEPGSGVSILLILRSEW